MAPHRFSTLLVAILLMLFLVSCEEEETLLAEMEEKSSEEKNLDEEGSEEPPLFLTPLIESGDIQSAQQQSRVTVSSSPPVLGYSGYLTVNKQYSSNLFFWFFPAQEMPETAPLVLWLQGGPGDSTFIGLFLEHGPYWVDDDLSLQPRDTSWNRIYNMLYIDSPVETGLSFTEDEAGFATSLSEVTEDLYSALQQFFTLFPQYQKNDFYAAGESYGGKYAPAIAHKIHEENPTVPIKINLKGVAIGDGLCHPEFQLDMADFVYQAGLVDEETYAVMQELVKKMKQYIADEEWAEVYPVWLEGLNEFLAASGYEYFYNSLQPIDPNKKQENNYKKLLKQPHIRKGLHFGNRNFHDWEPVFTKLIPDVPISMKSVIEELAENYKVLLYSGNLDVIINYPQTERFVKILSWSGAEEYNSKNRTKWFVSGELAGYVTQVNDFSHVVVLNAGHMVPADQPQVAQELFTRFISGKPLDSE